MARLIKRCIHCDNLLPDVVDVIKMWLRSQEYLHNDAFATFCDHFRGGQQSIRSVLTNDRRTSWTELLMQERLRRLQPVYGDTIADLHRHVGFTDTLKFSRWFRRAFGIPYRVALKRYPTFEQFLEAHNAGEITYPYSRDS